MKEFVYLKEQEVSLGQYLLPSKIKEKQAGKGRIFYVPRCKQWRVRDGLLQRKVVKMAQGLPIITTWPLGSIPVYQPHKKLYDRELETVLRKAGRRLSVDFSAQDIGIVCETLHDAQQLLSRLTAPMIWVFCQEEGELAEREETSPVFFSREEQNISRLPAVIALTDSPVLSYLSKQTVLFNLTSQDLVRNYTVNDAWMRIGSEYSEMDKRTLNSVLYDLGHAEKVSSLRWG